MFSSGFSPGRFIKESLWVLLLVLFFDREKHKSQLRLHDLIAATGKRLAIIVPFTQNDIDLLESNISSWIGIYPPCALNTPTSSYTDLYLYYHRDLLRISAHLRERLAVLQAKARRTRCFGHVGLLMANLGDDSDGYPLGPSVMFFRMIELPFLIDKYEWAWWMEPDCRPCRRGWLDRIYGLASLTGNEWWQIGAIMQSNDPLATHYPYADHLNGNALYHIASADFQQFLANVQEEFAKNKGRFLHSFDVAIYLTLRNLMGWTFYAENRHRFVYTNTIVNMYNMHANATKAIASKPNMYIIHGKNVVW